MRKSKRGSRTAGWHAQAPGQRERTVMRKKCGAKCFLGPGTSFPVCTRGTCTINSRGVHSAYNRARQWGHVSVAKRAKRILHD